MSNVDTPKILFSGPVHLVKTDTLPDVLLEGRIYVVESTGQQTLILPGGGTVEVGGIPADLDGVVDGQTLIYDDATGKFIPGGAGGGALEMGIYQYRVDGSTATAAIAGGDWETVPLATEVRDGIAGASLASNAVTLPAGTYLMEYFGQVYYTTQTLGLTAQVRLYNGSAEVAGSGGSTQTFGKASGEPVNVTAISKGTCVVPLVSETDIELQIQASVAATYGPQSYASQVCGELKITPL